MLCYGRLIMMPRRFFWVVDLATLALALVFAYLLFPDAYSYQAAAEPMGAAGATAGQSAPVTGVTQSAPPFWSLLAFIPVTILFLEVFGNYTPLIRQSYTRILAGGMLSPVVGLSIVLLLLFAIRDPGWSRRFIFSFAAVAGLGLAAYRVILRLYLRRRQKLGYYAKNVLMIGSPGAVDIIHHHFYDNPDTKEYRLLGYLQLATGQPPSSPNGRTLPLLGDVDALGNLLIRRPIHEVIAVYPSVGGAWLQKVIEDCEAFRVTLRILPEALLSNDRSTLQKLYHAEQLKLPSIVLRSPAWESEALFFKRLFDVVFSAVLVVLLSPLLLAIAAAIKLTTPGLPVLYPWRVVGQKGVEFTGYKFTSMYADADALKPQLLGKNEMSGPVFKIKNDPRITPLGRILRKYSLDELPQLWSVIKGDMSLVGPRPAFRHELERFEMWQKRKLSVRPGITCLWQVRGRNRIRDFNEWVRMDLEYIDNWSLWLDFKILLRTAGAVLRGTGS
jgi:exopolysaccharide biosynthesis polyprenyl glycosylphosphotransferase